MGVVSISDILIVESLLAAEHIIERDVEVERAVRPTCVEASAVRRCEMSERDEVVSGEGLGGLLLFSVGSEEHRIAR